MSKCTERSNTHTRPVATHAQRRYLGSSSLSSGTALVRMMTEDGTDSSHTEGSKWPHVGENKFCLEPPRAASKWGPKDLLPTILYQKVAPSYFCVVVVAG